MPTEARLTVEYEVSRATVRAAIQSLESLGFVRSQQGSGTYALARPSVLRGDLRLLESMTATIGRSGKTATSEFRPVQVRPATGVERLAFDLAGGDEVLATARDIRADGELVAYSEETIPMAVVGDADVGDGLGASIFGFLTDRGFMPVVAEAELHASGPHPDSRGFDASDLFVRVDQLHRDRQGTPVMRSSSYYLEGRFTFGLTRTR